MVPRKRGWRIERLGVVVIVPLPTLDRNGRPVSAFRLKSARRLVMKWMSTAFGGVTLVPATGGWWTQLTGTLMEDRRQVAAISMTTPSDFRRREKALEGLVAEVAELLGQEAMAVMIMSDTQGYLLFPRE